MFFSYAAVVFAAMAGVNAHSSFLSAQGESGSPASVGFVVDPSLARNCTTPSPCQQDSTIIREGEIKAKVVGVCGRTEQNGPIDVKKEMEKAIKSKNVTEVKGGTELTMVVHQVNADGAGPYTCDVDETGNGKFKSVKITKDVPGANGLSQAKTAQFQMKAVMPNDIACKGGSTGDVCVLRCRNAAQAGPFGTCMAVRQAAAAGNGGATKGGASGNTKNNAGSSCNGGAATGATTGNKSKNNNRQ